MRIQSSMPAQHYFSHVPRADIPRSTFNRSHGIKTTFNAGFLVPFFLDEVLPGDTFNAQFTGFARLATPLFPFMDNVYIDVHYFYVPNRLLWNNWEKFNGEQDNPGDSTSFLVPQQVAPVGGYTTNSLQDYLGLPTLIAGLTHSALPLRMYNFIYNEWYRDQNLQNSLVVDRGDGPDTVSNYVLRRRGKRHDYFTSCLPFPQKGPIVSIGLTGNAPVRGIGIAPSTAVVAGPVSQIQTGGTSNMSNIYNPTSGNLNFQKDGSNAALNIFADLSAVAAASINSLRQSFQIQRLYERDARGGTRYKEIILAHFGVVSDDARLDRPEYLGGGTAPVVINPVAQTSAVTGQPTPQGNLAAIGTAVLNRLGFTKSFTEHGYVIGLLSVRADLTYQQGLHRMWSRSTRFDFYWPALSHIGEQAVLNKEIYARNDANDNLVFGYQERHAEYRYKPSQICGQFRSNATGGSLDTWHLAQNFASLPLLNASFIEENPPINRVIAVPSQPHFIMDGFMQLKTARPMPVQSVPGLIDHF